MNRSPQVQAIHNAIRTSAAEIECIRAEQWERLDDTHKNLVLRLAGIDRYREGSAPTWSRLNHSQRNEVLKTCRLLEKIGNDCAVIR